jgi:hypothetical protein
MSTDGEEVACGCMVVSLIVLFLVGMLAIGVVIGWGLLGR